jgi:hypothetical protein
LPKKAKNGLGEKGRRETAVLHNRSFNTDAQRHCAAKLADELAPHSAMPLHAGQLQR